MSEEATVLILDFGSQTTQLIARRVREANVYSEILPGNVTAEAVLQKRPKALIFSGGPSSVYEAGAPSLDPRILELGLPILGICYGMQLIAHTGGGVVEPGHGREFGRAPLSLKKSALFGRISTQEIEVWMSHGDRVVAVPEGFVVIAENPQTPFCAVEHPEKKIFGVQFHPEVVHTPQGKELIAAFLFDVAGLAPSWTAESFVDTAIRSIRERVGTSHAILGLSGGVDSSVAAILCDRALGAQLTCIFIDNGLLRQGEALDVVRMFRDHFHLNLIAVDASETFLSALAGETDPEKKRKIIGRVFIEVFEAEASKIKDAEYLVQGTLYPDVIESVSLRGPSAVIKSHHNVGGLPERMKLKLCEPLRELFKDEVRHVGEALGMPKEVLYRHPFPGPGLAVRCLGPLTAARLETLRKADAIFIDEIRKAGLYDSIWQAFCALLPVRSVGVMGDDRTYEETAALRAVTSTDGMTADWFRMPHEVLSAVSTRIINEVRGVNRVVYDVSSKPPATIEWE